VGFRRENLVQSRLSGGLSILRTVSESTPVYRDGRYLLTAASIVVVIAGLKAAAPVLLPVLLAAMFAIVAIPPIRFLERRGCPGWLSVALIMLAASLVILFVSAVVAGSIHAFRESLPEYRARLDEIMADGFALLSRLGVDLSPDELSKKIDTGAIWDLVGDTAGGVVRMMSNLFLVLLLLIFMLFEAGGFGNKLRRALGDPDADLGEYTQAADRVYQYLFIKACVSAATGILVSLLTWGAGVDFPLLWGMVAFMFNFVPNIGSIIAAVPAVLLALIQHGALTATGVGAGYLVINLVLGNAVEPKIMGEKLGLSTLVVFLSLLFWGWLWGPVGMLLSVPLTVIVKIVLEHSQQFRGAAILLGK
jgi:predicted PurR-regulated permease PerM